jgi:hypothetical protein
VIYHIDRVLFFSFFVWFCRLSAALCCSSFGYCVLIFHFVVVFISFMLKDQLQSIADSINNLDVNVADPETWIFRYFNFIILFVGNLTLYAMNLDAVNLFSYSSFTFLAILNLYLYLMYSVNYWNEWISLFFVKKII